LLSYLPLMPGCHLVSDLSPSQPPGELGPACSPTEGETLLGSLYTQVEQACAAAGRLARPMADFAAQLRETDCLATTSCTYNPVCFEGFISVAQGKLCQLLTPLTPVEVRDEDTAIDDIADSVARHPSRVRM
jgi:hypothetical protein